MILHIDTDKMEALGLTDREMWLYLTLSILCAKKPWQGTDEELATKCKNNMSRVTILRLKKSLIEKDLITETKEGLVIVQNEHENVQNEHENVQNEQKSVQNEQKSKEKEKNQKKIEKEDVNKNIKGGDNNGAPAPTWEEVKDYCLQHNIPLETAKLFFCYYEGTGWTFSGGGKVQKWQAVLMRWSMKDEQDQRKSRSLSAMRSGRPHPQETIISEEACRRRDLDWQRHLQEQAQHDALVAQEESDPKSLAEREAILQRLCRRLGSR